jgi:hypothetical protein
VEKRVWAEESAERREEEERLTGGKRARRRQIGGKSKDYTFLPQAVTISLNFRDYREIEHEGEKKIGMIVRRGK